MHNTVLTCNKYKSSSDWKRNHLRSPSLLANLKLCRSIFFFFKKVQRNQLLLFFKPFVWSVKSKQIPMVLIFCVEFRELSHLTRDLWMERTLAVICQSIESQSYTYLFSKTFNPFRLAWVCWVWGIATDDITQIHWSKKHFLHSVVVYILSLVSICWQFWSRGLLGRGAKLAGHPLEKKKIKHSNIPQPLAIRRPSTKFMGIAYLLEKSPIHNKFYILPYNNWGYS